MFACATARPTCSGARRTSLICHAKKSGFGKTGTAKRGGNRSRPDRIREELDEALEENQPPGVIARRSSRPSGDYWFKIADLSVFKKGKDTAVATTQTGRNLVLYRVGDLVYCSTANSTAFDFPLIDATVTPSGPSGGPEIEVPLDGTRYALATGAVLEWCPKNNPLRTVLGALKSTTEPKPLPVYDCVVTDEEEIYVRLAS